MAALLAHIVASGQLQSDNRAAFLYKLLQPGFQLSLIYGNTNKSMVVGNRTYEKTVWAVVNIKVAI